MSAWEAQHRDLLKASNCIMSYDSIRFNSLPLLHLADMVHQMRTMMMFGGTIKCLLNEMGFEVSSTEIAAITQSPFAR